MTPTVKPTQVGGLHCALCHGTLEFLTNKAEPWSAGAYSPCPYCHPAAKKSEAGGLLPLPESMDEAIRNVADWANTDGDFVGRETKHAMEVLRGHIHAYAQANVQALEARLVALRDALKDCVSAMDIARDTIQPITTAQIKLHNLNPETDRLLDSAAAKAIAALLESAK